MGFPLKLSILKHGLGKHPENGGDEPLLLTVKGAQCCTLSAQGGLSGIAIKGSKGRNEQYLV